MNHKHIYLLTLHLLVIIKHIIMNVKKIKDIVKLLLSLEINLIIPLMFPESIITFHKQDKREVPRNIKQKRYFLDALPREIFHTITHTFYKSSCLPKPIEVIFIRDNPRVFCC